MLRPLLRVAGLGLATGVLAPVPLAVAIATAGSRNVCAETGMRAQHLWSRLVCRILGVRVTSEGEPPRGAAVVASNHLGYLDILVLGAVYPSHFVSMAEVKRWPLVGPLARLVGTLFIERGTPGEIPRVTADMAFHLEHGRPITFFPEGRTSPGLTVQEFRSSLLQPAVERGVPCVPVAITYDAPGAAAPPSQAVCWWGEAQFAPHFRGLLELPRIEARVRFGPPQRGSERKALGAALREAVLQRFVPVRQA